jgi:hypothetical protein
MLDNGVFDDGPQPMLWRPDLDHDRLRRRGVLESVIVEPLPFALVGLAVAIVIGGRIGTVIAVLILALAAVWAVSAYRCWGLDCFRPNWTRHRRDRGAGEWFYRPADFDALPNNCRRQVARLFAALVVFDEPVSCWRGTVDRATVHELAWQLLECLHATLSTRAVLARVPADLAGDPEVADLRHQLVQLDTDLAAGVDAVCEISVLVRGLAVRITAPSRRAALHTDLACLRLPVPPVVGGVRDEVRARVDAVHEFLDLVGTTP